MKAWRQYVYRLSVTLLTRAREYAATERRRLNSLNYGDLLILTAKVLRENAAVRRALQRKYRYLFVDEFQDTDPVQAEIVFLLAARKTDCSARRPSRTGVRTGDRASLRTSARSFVVGDPKQSIYRFRRADIEIYNTVRERFADPSIGRVVPLTTNFRSVPALCEWANEVFDGPFPAQPTPHSPRFARLDPGGKQAGQAGGIFTLSYSGEPKGVAVEDANRIARYIRSEVDAGRRRFSDFLILTRKKKDRIAPYASALEALNIPLEVSGAGAFGESEEVSGAHDPPARPRGSPRPAAAHQRAPRPAIWHQRSASCIEYKQAGGWFSIFAGIQEEGTPSPFDPRAASRNMRTAEGEGRGAVRAALAALARLSPLDAHASRGRRAGQDPGALGLPGARLDDAWRCRGWRPPARRRSCAAGGRGGRQPG